MRIQRIWKLIENIYFLIKGLLRYLMMHKYENILTQNKEHNELIEEHYRNKNVRRYYSVLAGT